MCDFVDGQIILAAPSGGPAAYTFMNDVIEYARVLGLSRLGDLYTVLEQAEAQPGPAAESLRAELYECVPGMEGRAISRLYRRWMRHVVENYPERRVERLWIGRNHVLTGAAAPLPWELQEATDSPLGGLDNHVALGGRPRIAVLDSGIFYPPGITLPTVGKEHNFIGPDPASAVDGLGHGTVVAACIAAIDPDITVDVLKVISDKDVATEFDVLAALAGDTVHNADVVNLSLVFGLQDASCGKCGDRHHSSMSEVFLYMLDKVAENGSMVVAAAGNNNGTKRDPLCYPARFTGVIAVGALDDDGTVLAISNVGVMPTDDHDRPWLVFAPGRAVLDRVEAGGATKEITGTSIACAYVSAMLAVIKDRGGYDNQDTVDSMLAAATTLTDHDDTEHGYGQVTWPRVATP